MEKQENKWWKCFVCVHRIFYNDVFKPLKLHASLVTADAALAQVVDKLLAETRKVSTHIIEGNVEKWLNNLITLNIIKPHT